MYKIYYILSKYLSFTVAFSIVVRPRCVENGVSSWKLHKKSLHLTSPHLTSPHLTSPPYGSRMYKYMYSVCASMGLPPRSSNNNTSRSSTSRRSSRVTGVSNPKG